MQATSNLLSLFDATVPVLSRYLGQLQGLLNVAAQHIAAHGLPERDLLAARLAPDMLPLGQQVEVAVNFAFRTCAPLAQRAANLAAPVDASVAALTARISQAQAFLHDLRPEEFTDAAGRIADDSAGQADIHLDGLTYACQYALPNFFFHLSMVYALLRQQGVAVGKPDFDGWHVYPSPRAQTTISLAPDLL
ncbi:MAG: DUF1993 domain-containing protein [Rhodoferax sp.]|nr:DUF1993 domain-containing protein [Rhodoferax sp.]